MHEGAHVLNNFRLLPMVLAIFLTGTLTAQSIVRIYVEPIGNPQDPLREETIRLLDLADDRLGVLVESNEIEPSVKKALGELASQRQALARRNTELDKLKEQRRQLVEDCEADSAGDVVVGEGR